MEPIVNTRQLNNHQRIAPGRVGSLGVTNQTFRLKHSAPDMPLRNDPNFSGYKSLRLGSNVQDGATLSYDSGGGPARTYDSNWNSGRSFKVANGWYYQDLRAPDTRIEPLMGSTGRYDWYNRVANVYESKRTGDLFLPLPGPYQIAPGEVPRGGMTPRVTAEEGVSRDFLADNSLGLAQSEISHLANLNTRTTQNDIGNSLRSIFQRMPMQRHNPITTRGS